MVTGAKLLNSLNICSVQEKVVSIDLMNCWKSKHNTLAVSRRSHHVTAIHV